MSGRVQGTPSAIPSNSLGAGLVEGDQIGEIYPGILSSLQEAPSASKSSNLYYDADVAQFKQPAYQRAFGMFNLSLNIQRFGDSGTVEVNPDIFWKGPMQLSTTFTIPYAYYGVHTCRPNGVNFLTQAPGNIVAFQRPADVNGAYGPANRDFFVSRASGINVKPRMFYSWGAAYANIRDVRLNMGGAMVYVLDHYANFVGVMASTMGVIQRAALMKAAGGGLMIQDDIERHLGLDFVTTEVGMQVNYAADGTKYGSADVELSYTSFGEQGSCTPSSIPAPSVEHWVCSIKTPNTNYSSSQFYRRPIDTRLFSTNFVIDFFTNPNVSSFIDTGTGFQPQLGIIPAAANALPIYTNWMIPTNLNSKVFDPIHHTLFPSCLYRQYQIPGASAAIADVVNTYISGFSLTNFNNPDNRQAFRFCLNDYTDFSKIIRSQGYHDTTGFDIANPSADTLLITSAESLPQPAYNTLINAVRLGNDQLGAKVVLQSRPDQCVTYPFQHFTTQTYMVNQAAQANTFSQFTPGQQTSFVNTVTGGQGFGNISEVDLRNYNLPPSSRTVPITVAISIPVNPLTCLYIMVMREKDRMNLGFSTPQQYSPALFWNSLELAQFSLTYANQILQKYDTYGEYLCAQLHERVEPLVVPFKGGPVCRSDLPTTHPEKIQDSPLYPGAWYTSYIYELCMVDQLPMANEAFLQQTPSFRGELLNFSFQTKPTIRPYNPFDFDFRRNVGTDTLTPPNADANYELRYRYMEKIAGYCLDIPQCALYSTINNPSWNLNDDNLTIVCVFAQNAVWQLNPYFSKVVFARGA